MFFSNSKLWRSSQKLIVKFFKTAPICVSIRVYLKVKREGEEGNFKGGTRCCFSDQVIPNIITSSYELSSLFFKKIYWTRLQLRSYNPILLSRQSRTIIRWISFAKTHLILSLITCKMRKIKIEGGSVLFDLRIIVWRRICFELSFLESIQSSM